VPGPIDRPTSIRAVAALLAHPQSPSWRRGAIFGSSVDRSAFLGFY
jgi:hypothetical protein